MNIIAYHFMHGISTPPSDKTLLIYMQHWLVSLQGKFCIHYPGRSSLIYRSRCGSK